jgi:hypothetical protein
MTEREALLERISELTGEVERLRTGEVVLDLRDLVTNMGPKAFGAMVACWFEEHEEAECEQLFKLLMGHFRAREMSIQ